MTPPTQRIRIGLRRETVIMVPVALVILVFLSTVTLFSYRGGIRLLLDERSTEATRTATRLAERIAGDEPVSAAELRRMAPAAFRVALMDASGSAVAGTRRATGVGLLEDFGPDLDRPQAIGPTEAEETIAALAPTSIGGRRHYVRIDVPAHTLAQQLRTSRLLTWLVLAINAGLSILVLLFLRHLLTPYDRLLARARQVLPQDSAPEDEVSFLIASFERALETLQQPTDAEPSEAAGEDAITALQQAVGTSLESGLMLLDRDANILALNPAGVELLGIDPPESGTPAATILSALPELGDVADLITAAVDSGRAVQRQEVQITTDPARTLGLSVHALKRDDGTVRAYLVLFADLTEARRLAEEERVALSIAQVGEMAAGVAHEMRNSLATFRGYLTLIDRSPEEETILDYLTELRRETDHLQRVLEDFLSFARPGSTRMESVDIETILRRAASDPALEDVGVEIETRAAPSIKGDPQLLERALRNLLLNAAEAVRQVESTESIEPLVATVAPSDDHVTVEIADRGIGIPESIRETLFQPFVSGRNDGVGLGLALAHRIVHLHGGRLEMRDRAGGGTVASLEFPTARSQTS